MLGSLENATPQAEGSIPVSHSPHSHEEHPFAQYVRALGKGPNLSRPLTRDEARAAMEMILDGAVEPVQLGAFLCLLRVKTELPEEIAGMAQACQTHLARTAALPQADIDWASWAGKSRQLPLYLLAALALAASGIRVFMHGAEDHTQGRIYTSAALAGLGLSAAATPGQAAERMDRTNFAYMTLGAFAPAMQRIMDLKRVLGLRSPLHTVGRLLNPSRAPFTLSAVTHPPYLPLQQGASLLLGQPRMATFKGEGGEAERRPEKSCDVHYVAEGLAGAEEWPAMTGGPRPHAEHLDIGELAKIWGEDAADPTALAAIGGTMAIALKYAGRATSQEGALDQAMTLWRNRPRDLRCFL